MCRGSGPVSAASTGPRRHELLGIGLSLASGLFLPLRKFLFGDDRSIAELLRPLERNAELGIGREKALDVWIAPRRAKALIATGTLSLSLRAGAWQRNRHRQREPAHEHECASGHVRVPFVLYHTTSRPSGRVAAAGSVHAFSRRQVCPHYRIRARAWAAGSPPFRGRPAAISF